MSWQAATQLSRVPLSREAIAATREPFMASSASSRASRAAAWADRGVSKGGVTEACTAMALLRLSTFRDSMALRSSWETRFSSRSRASNSLALLMTSRCPPPEGSSKARSMILARGASSLLCMAASTSSRIFFQDLYLRLATMRLEFFCTTVATWISAISRASSSFPFCSVRINTLVCPLAHSPSSSTPREVSTFVSASRSAHRRSTHR
mmetsp:Transcript_11921/g.26504  ORF Transcript_11921/g.26504 Transcript_11921/m.26504 type:complete len:209 (-) Transcript_11921:2260-2886(-)